MVYNDYTKLRILYYLYQSKRPPTIALLLRNEGIEATRKGVANFEKRFLATGTIARRQGSGRKTVITEEIQQAVEAQMRRNDETTASQLHVLLTALSYQLSLRTVLRCRSLLGWTFRGSAYCQIIREVNKIKRLEWCQHYKDDDFADVVFSDECSIQLESHRRFSCRKRGELPKNKPRYCKHLPC